MRLPSATRTVLLLTTGITLAMTMATANAAPTSSHQPAASAKTSAGAATTYPFTGGAQATYSLRNSLSAAGSRVQCNANKICAFRETGFGGPVYAALDLVQSGRCEGYSRADWRSAINNSNGYARFWDHNNCTGANRLLAPGWSTADFGFAANSLGGL